MDKILTDWHDRKLKTTSDVNTYLVQSKAKSQNIKKLEKQTGYTNYEQRERSNWDDFYANTLNNTILDNNISNTNNFNNL